MSRLLDPAIALLNRLKYPQKFLLISALFALPLALALTQLIVQLDKDIAIASAEIHGSRMLVPLRGLLDASLRHQGLARQLLSGDSARQAELREIEATVDAQLADLAALDQIGGGALQSPAELAELQAGWARLRERLPALRPAESDEQHSQLVAAIRRQITRVGDSSNLILDPELSSYYTMDIVLLRLPDSQELIARIERLVAAGIPQRSLGAAERVELTTLAGLLDTSAQAVERSAAVVGRASPASGARLAAALGQYRAGSQPFSALLHDQVISKASIVLPADQLERVAGAASQANRSLWDSANRELEQMLQARLDALNAKKYSSLAATLLALALVLYLLLGFYVSVMRTVRTLDATAQRMTAGEAVAAVQLDSRDELGQVAHAFNNIALALIATSAQRQAVLDNAADAIVTVDEGGQIESFNAAAERIFGYAAADVLGTPVAHLMLAPHHNAYRQVGASHEIVGRRASASSFPLDLTVGEMQHERGRRFVLIARDLSERKRADEERARLQERIISAQAEALSELSTPLIPISDTVVVVPLIGALDAQRMRQVLGTLLQGVERTRARVAIVDITGVPVIDSEVAEGIVRAARAVELLGARVVVTGIRPEVAQALVGLGTDLHAIVTHSTLQSGIAYAMGETRFA